MKKQKVDTAILNGLIDTIPQSIFWKDKELSFLGCNKMFANQFGYDDPKNIIGKYDSDFPFPEHLREQYNNDDRKILSSGVSKINFEEAQTQPDGSEKIVLVSKVPYYNGENEIIGVLGIYTDITNLKETEKNLIEQKNKAELANKAKTEFLENMRHDIRTPLTGIVGFANLIKDEAKDKKIKEYAENLTTSSHALLGFLNEVLESIRSISEETPLNTQKFDLKEKIEHVTQLNQATAHSKKIALEFEYDEKIPKYLVGDGKRIYRIVLELLTNALKYTPKGNIKISAVLVPIDDNDKKNVVIKISISDTGIGIEKCQQQAIFTRFHRLTPSSQGIYSGLGMGLAIVKQFIHDIDAEIYVDSTPNEGSTFTCIIPLKKALVDDDFGVDRPLESTPALQRNTAVSTTKPLKALKPKTVVGKNHILLVEDQPFAAQVVHDMLVTLDCDVDVAENGKAALQYIGKNKYDLIFMDVGLPDMDGNEITERIRLGERGTATHIPIIALTAHIDEESRKRCIEAGMEAVLSKPLGKETAEDILKAFIPSRYSNTKKKSTKEALDTGKNVVNPLLTLDGLVIDLALGAKILRCDKASAKKMIGNLLSSAESDMEILDKAHKNKDWNTILEIAHKTRGGAAYCGTPRIYQAFSHLNDYLKSGETELAEALYQQAVGEMDKLKKEYKP